jgi:putative hydrolase of the HAD superfamily
MQRRLITFDLDNTLWDVNTVILTAEKAMRGWLQEHVPEVVAFYQTEGVADIRAQVLADHPQLKHDLSRLRTLVVQRSIEACGYGSAEAATLAEGAFTVFMEGRHRVQYFEGALETLERLTRRYTLAALSNGNADIARLGLDRYFAFSCSAADVGESKPAPGMFLAAIRRVGVKPEDAAHIGDHLHDDIAGALGVGMHAVWCNFSGVKAPDDSARPSAVVTSLSDVPAVVDQLFSAK